MTAKGICRYDGQRIYPFPLPSDSDAEKNLASLEQSLTSAAEDSSGTLWFGTKSGLLRFIPRTGVWRWYKQTKAEDAMFNYILLLYCDTKGTLWIGTRGGLMQYDEKKDVCRIPFPDAPHEGIQSICENKNGSIWFGIHGQAKVLIAYNIHTKKLTSASLPGWEGGYFMHRISSDKGAWISPLVSADETMLEPRLVVLDTIKNTFNVSAPAFSLSPSLLRGIFVYPFAEDGTGAWFVKVHDYAAGRCENGLYRIVPHLDSDIVQVRAEDSTLFRGLTLRGSVTAFHRDPHTGIVCVGFNEQGVTILIPTGAERLSDRNSIGDVISLYTDRRARLWCGTRKGLFMQTQGGFALVRQVPNVLKSVPVYDIQETSTGTIIVATAEGILRYDESQKALYPLTALAASVGMTTIGNICPDPFSKDLWVNVLSVGVVRCREDGSVIEYFEYGRSSNEAEVQRLGTERIFSMQFDKRGDLWMSGMGVLLRRRRQTGKLEQVKTIQGVTQTIIPVKLISTETDVLIAALNGTGFGYLNTAIPSFTEALLPRYIYTAPINSRLRDVQILGTSRVDSVLWWTTQTNGVYRARHTNNASNTLSLGSPELILPSDENVVKDNSGGQASALSAQGASAGAITTDGNGGVVFDYYGDVLQANHTARVFTDTARVVPIGYFRNDSVMAGLPQHGDTLHCIYGGSFALSCAVVSLARPERHCLEYRLEGVDADWNIMPDASLRTVRYSSLQPGEYRLLVRTRTQDPHDEQPLLSANTLAFTVYVPYPWWMHPVTRTLGFLVLAAGFVWTGYTVQHRRTLQRMARLEREKEFENVQRLASEAQMQTLRLQMNPHFLYNVLAEIQMLVESGNEMASYYIAVFSRLLDRVLRKAVNNFISVSDEIHILKKYIELEELRNAGHLKCYVMLTPDAANVVEAEYDDDESDESDTEYWRSREMPTFILQPFVENAIRHGIRGLAEEDWKTRPAGGIITIHLFEEGDSLRCVVTDNGIGREEAARRKAARPAGAHLSIATSVTHERLQLLEKAFDVHLSIRYNDLYDETGAAAGTEVTVVMPLRAVQA